LQISSKLLVLTRAIPFQYICQWHDNLSSLAHGLVPFTL
jgi:hypothetical protein